MTEKSDAVPLLLASMILLFQSACGVKGPPQPPLPDTPQASDPADRDELDLENPQQQKTHKLYKK